MHKTQTNLSKFTLKNDINIICSDCWEVLKEITEEEYNRNTSLLIKNDIFLKNKGPIRINNIKNKCSEIYNEIINEKNNLRNKHKNNNKKKLINLNVKNNGNKTFEI